MKINQIGNHGVNPYQRNVEKATQMETSKKPVDKVEISSHAKNLQEISMFEKNREAKVNAIKSQVEQGTYSPNPKDIAKKLLDFYR